MNDVVETLGGIAKPHGFDWSGSCFYRKTTSMAAHGSGEFPGKFLGINGRQNLVTEAKNPLKGVDRNNKIG